MSGTGHRFCVLMPAYREGKKIREVLRRILKHCRDTVVIDDGSDDGTAEEAEKTGATVLRHRVNRGKGAALATGFEYAGKGNFEFVIVMDADGQHDPDDIPVFIRAFDRGAGPVIAGNRMGNTENMPLVRRMTNRFMSGLLSGKMGQRVPDTQCGYRLYAAEVLELIPADSGRFAAESEVLLRLADAGVKINSVPVKVIYGSEKSKINPLRDTFRFFAMLRRYGRGRGREKS
ncbi:MAG: glycosyltransferase family 2 protein [Kiritimatiellia bacterium]